MTTKHSEKKLRYAVVGLGHIAQVAVLPAFKHASGNSELFAVVTDDPAKARAAREKYGVTRAFGYADYDACLALVDAVYIALPNFMHAEYTVRAAQAGVHVLCEKPMAVTADECERMIAACRDNDVRLMVAYRLHLEPTTLEVLDLVRSGRIGEPKYFSSNFSMRVRPGNIRTLGRDLGGGSVYDIGIYCINAARAAFGAEPKEVVAAVVNSGVRHLSEVDESTAATLRFDEERIASFVSSFNAADLGEYRIAGTSGHIHVDPGYEYASGLAYTLTVNGEVQKKHGPKRDQFAAELVYFSDCVLQQRDPEPSGMDGLQDVRIIQAIYESANTGKAVQIPPIPKESQPTPSQGISKPPLREPRTVNVESASQD